jgi:hypothetical protein
VEGGGKASPTTESQECAVAVSLRIPEDGTLVPIYVADTCVIPIYIYIYICLFNAVYLIGAVYCVHTAGCS